MLEIFVYAISLILSFTVTYLVYVYAEKLGVIDTPNERSLHVMNKPRSGGLGFVVVLLAVVPILQYVFLIELIPSVVIWSFLVIALVGFIDDVRSLSAISRLVTHLIMGFLTCYLLWSSKGYELTTLLAFSVWVAWWVNLFNFMDGADGFAGLQALLFFGLDFILSYYMGSERFFPGIMFFAVFGFWLLNFPPSKIFMGDVGSGAIGYLMGWRLVDAYMVNKEHFWLLLIITAPFLVESFVTVTVRALTGQKVWKAHSSHVFQKLVRAGKTHRQLLLIYGSYWIFWVLPIVIAVLQFNLNPTVGLILACIPSVFMCFIFKAGYQDRIINT